MPALSGPVLAKIIMPYCKDKQIPLVFYSSNDEESLKRVVKEFGATDYICKGDIAELKKKVSRYVGLS